MALSSQMELSRRNFSRRKERVKWNKKRGRSFYVVILRYP